MNWKKYCWLALLFGCAGVQRDCASCGASNFGADWIVVQYNYAGVPINCWKLADVGIDNEQHSDGVFWKDTKSGSLVHISGWYNRVQVEKSDYAAAATTIGIDLARCDNGKYVDGKDKVE